MEKTEQVRDHARVKNGLMEKVTIKAPGRVCLFGEHQDYLGFPVIACAIDRYITLEAVDNATEFFKINMPDVGKERAFPIHEKFSVLKERDYFASGIRVLRRKDIIPTKGFDIKITGDIPINSGLSSSSALCAAWLSFLIKAFAKEKVSRSDLAKFVYESEVTEHDEPGGNMDQFSVVFGGLSKISTSHPFEVEGLVDPGIKMLIADSGIQKDTLGLLFKTKKNSLEALRQVKRNHPDIDLFSSYLKEVGGLIEELDEDLGPYFIAAIMGHDITRKAVREFQNDPVDLSLIAKLMNEHQDLLRENLQVSIPQLDKLIQVSLQEGAISAKLVGSGGGGCIVVLVDRNVDQVKRSLEMSGAKDVFDVNVSKGAYDLNFA